jgi:UDP-glucose 4-epimerase
MTKIAIIGSNGFIGKNLVSSLSEKFQVFGFNNIVSGLEFERLSNFISVAEPDVIINCTGSGNVSKSFESTFLDFQQNVETVQCILESVKKNERNIKFLHFSSAAVYGNPENEVSSELDQKNPISPYGFHKSISEEICKNYFYNFNIPIVIVRPFSVYGNGQKKLLFWDILNKLMMHDQCELFGSGKESRDFIHISDLCEAVKLIILHSEFDFDVYNLANGQSVEISQVTGIISTQYPNNRLYFNGKIREGDPTNWRADITKIKMLGYKQQVDLEKGINDYIGWYESNK